MTKLLLLIGVAAAACLGQSSTRGSISGRVLDPSGKPFPDVRVWAWRWDYHDGRKQLAAVMTDAPVTGDDGSFVLDDLDPGQYLVRAENPYAGIADLAIAVPLPQMPNLSITYFPGVIDPVAATAVDVKAGQETGGIEFRAQDPRLFHISGRVSGPGRGPRFLNSQDGLEGRIVHAGAGGSFEVDRVPPGAYVLEGDNMQYATRAVVTVANADIDNLVVNSQPCPKVHGQMTIDGAPVGSTPQSRGAISLSRAEMAMSVPGLDTGNGNFAVACAAPEFYDSGIPLQPGTYVKSVTLDGKEVTNSISYLDFTSFGDKTLNIELSSRVAEVRGILHDAEGKPKPGVPVSLWRWDTGFNATAESAPDGSFEFTNLAPGVYRAAAWDGLRPQPKGWGVQTVREFRDHFDALAARITLGESEHANVEPAIVPRASIEEALKRLKLMAAMTQPAQDAEISEAVKSPETLVAYAEAHHQMDWASVWKALGVTGVAAVVPACSDRAWPCETETVTVAAPDQTIVIFKAALPRWSDVYVRYLRDGNGWKFAGAQAVLFNEGVRRHELANLGDKPILKVASNHAQNGAGIQQELEDWFDLSLSDFEPVFSFTVDGGQWRFGFGVGHTTKAAFKTSQAAAVDRIEVSLAVTYDGAGLDDFPAAYTGVYERAAGEKKFTLRRASIPTKDFEELADPFSDISSEKLLVYAMPGLRKIATGSDADAEGWLRSVLDNAGDTPEKRTLLDLLGKP